MSQRDALSRAQSLVRRQPTAYDQAPNNVHPTGGRFDAGHSGSKQTPLTGRIQTRNPRSTNSAAGSFPAPMSGTERHITKDEENSRQELNVIILHEGVPPTQSAREFFVFSPGMFCFNALDLNQRGGGVRKNRTPAITMINLQSVNMLCNAAHAWGQQVVANGLRAPSASDNRGDPSAKAAARGGYYDVYEPVPTSFSEPMQTLACNIGGYPVTHREFESKFRFLGLWLAEGQPQEEEYVVSGFYSFGDLHSEHYIRRPGADSVSTITMHGRFMAGVPNVIGPSVRNMMALCLITKRSNAPGMWDSLEGFQSTAIQVGAWGSSRVDRPFMMTSSNDYAKYKAGPGEDQVHPLSQMLYRYGGNRKGTQNTVSFNPYRNPGERQQSDICPTDPRVYEPYQDRCSLGIAHYWTAKDGLNAYTTVEEECAFSIGRVFDISGTGFPSDATINQSMTDIPSFHHLKSVSKFAVHMTRRVCH